MIIDKLFKRNKVNRPVTARPNNNYNRDSYSVDRFMVDMFMAGFWGDARELERIYKTSADEPEHKKPVRNS